MAEPARRSPAGEGAARECCAHPARRCTARPDPKERSAHPPACSFPHTQAERRASQTDRLHRQGGKSPPPPAAEPFARERAPRRDSGPARRRRPDRERRHPAEGSPRRAAVRHTPAAPAASEYNWRSGSGWSAGRQLRCPPSEKEHSLGRFLQNLEQCIGGRGLHLLDVFDQRNPTLCGKTSGPHRSADGPDPVDPDLIPRAF